MIDPAAIDVLGIETVQIDRSLSLGAVSVASGI